MFVNENNIDSNYENNNNTKSEKRKNLSNSLISSIKAVSTSSIIDNNNNNIISFDSQSKNNSSIENNNNKNNTKNNNNNNIIYIIIENDNTTIPIDFSLSVKAYPDIFSYLDFDNKTLTLSSNIFDFKNLKDYFTYVKYTNINNYKNNQIDLKNLTFNFKKLLLYCNYFNNENILTEIFNRNIIPNINNETCINLIIDAFNNCCDIQLNNNIKSKWFSLFIQLRDYIINNFVYFLEDNNVIKLKKLNLKLLNEIIESFLLDIYNKNIEISSENASTIIILLCYIFENENNNNNEFINLEKEINFSKIFTYLSYKTTVTNQEEIYIKNNLNKYFESIPTFSINLLKDLNYNYQEKLIKFYKQELIFITNYNKINDSFKIILKLNPINNIDAFSFLSYTHILEEDNPNNNNSNSNSNNIKNEIININTEVTLYTIENFKSYITYMKGINECENLILEVNLKFNVINSFIICYLKSCFNLFYNYNNISLLNYKVFNILMNNINYNDAYDEENLLKCVSFWLNSDINYNNLEKINEIFEQIKWKKIPLGKIFEFIIKYPNVIEKLKNIENEIIKSIFFKSNEKLKEFKKEKIFYLKNNNEQNNYENEYNKSKNSFHGDIERFEAIALRENNNNGNNLNFDMNNNNNENEKENNNNENALSEIINNESQINLISYFFINLFECSKKLNLHKLRNNQYNKIKNEKHIENKNINNNINNNINIEFIEKNNEIINSSNNNNLNINYLNDDNNNNLNNSNINSNKINNSNNIDESQINVIQADEKIQSIDELLLDLTNNNINNNNINTNNNNINNNNNNNNKPPNITLCSVIINKGKTKKNININEFEKPKINLSSNDIFNNSLSNNLNTNNDKFNINS